MKKIFSKILSGFIACTLLVFSIPFTASCDYEIDGIKYRVGSGGYIITDVLDTTITSIKIPEKIQLNGINLRVIGVDDYAFGYCNSLNTVYAPITLRADSMGNVAFLNARSIVEYINKEVGGNVTTNNIVKYIAKKLYSNENYTDAELNEIQKKIESKLDKVDTSGFNTPEDKVMTFIRNIDQMGLSKATIDKFKIWISTVPYIDMTIKGESGTDIQTYTEGRQFLGLKYEVTFTYKLNENGCELYYRPVSTKNDGVEDGISIIGYSGNIQEIVIPDKIKNLPIVDIADDAFSNAVNLNAIRIPKTVETIADESVGFHNGTQVPGFKVYGYSGTPVHRYAIKYSMTFIDVTTLPVLSHSELQLKPGDMTGIELSNYSGDIKWVSSDTTVATVASAATKDDPGVAYITAVSAGEATIYAFAGTTVLECHVTVSGEPIFTKVTGVTGSTQYTGDPPTTLSTKSTANTFTTLEPPISTISKTTTNVSTTLEPPITFTTKTTTGVSTTVNPPVSTNTKPSTSTSTSSSTTRNTTNSTSTNIFTGTSSTSFTSSSASSTSTNLISTSTSASTSVSTSASTSGSSTSSSPITSGSGTNVSTGASSTSSSSATSGSGTDISTGTFSTSSSSATSGSGTDVSTGTASTSSSPVSSSSATSGSSGTGSVGTTSSVSTTTSKTTTVTTTEANVVTKYVLLGDANEDGRVNIRDAAYIARMLAKRTPEVLPEWSDYNGDGVINIRDAAAIAIYLAKIGPKHFVKWIIVIKNK